MKTRISQTGRSPKNKGGFTLMEMMVVLLIIGFFTAVFSIRVENVFSGGDLRLASRMIISEIQKLRGTAAYTHREQLLTFDMDENAFFARPDPPEADGDLLQQEGGTFLEPKKERLPKGVKVEDVVLPGKGKVQEGEAAIPFFINGTVEGALIHLRNENDDAYTLEVNPLTGRVTIHDGYMERKNAA